MAEPAAKTRRRSGTSRPKSFRKASVLSDDRLVNDRLLTADRALAVLEHVASHPMECTVKEIAASLGLNLTTSYHLANTLLARGYLVKNQTRTLRLGPAVAILASAGGKRITADEELDSVLHTLSETTGETANLARWVDDQVVLQAVVEGPHPLRVTGLYSGMRGAPHCRASGKAILAHLDREQLERVLRTLSLTPNTANTITDVKTLRAHLLDVRDKGYAVDAEEFALGVCCIAAPYFGQEGQVDGAIAISAPATRFKLARKKYREAVIEAAAACSRVLGLHRPSRAHSPSRVGRSSLR